MRQYYINSRQMYIFSYNSCKHRYSCRRIGSAIFVMVQCANCGCEACLSRVSGEFSGADTNGCARDIENKRDLRYEYCVYSVS